MNVSEGVLRCALIDVSVRITDLIVEGAACSIIFLSTFTAPAGELSGAVGRPCFSQRTTQGIRRCDQGSRRLPVSLWK